MIAAKTAALFGASSQLGALCAPCDADTVLRYSELGRAFGMAFQIRDDVLGIWGTLDATGKVSGNDIARRKWTFPVVWALTQPRSAVRDVITSAYARGGTLDNGTVASVVDALDELGARDAANQAAAGHLSIVERHPVKGVREFLLSSLELAST